MTNLSLIFPLTFILPFLFVTILVTQQPPSHNDKSSELVPRGIVGAPNYYTLISYKAPGALAIINNTGHTNTTFLRNMCDAVPECAGFSTHGILLKSVFNLTLDNTQSIWQKDAGTPLKQLPIRPFPMPRQMTQGHLTFTIDPKAVFKSNSKGEVITQGIERYQKYIFEQGDPFDYYQTKSNINAEISLIYINIENPSEDLNLKTNYSYELDISSSIINISASSPYGALYALESLSQLVIYDFISQTYTIPDAPIQIKDFPKFAHRGILLDTSRHYQPISLIEKLLDSMLFAKLNVLHWHIVDTQSFPIEIPSFPLLWTGSWTSREKYTLKTISEVVTFAKFRGIRVIPEFDGPAHSGSWGIGYPEILPEGVYLSKDCYNTCPTGPCDVPIDPTNPKVYEIIKGILKDTKNVFFDDHFHMGGDEVEYGCWSLSQSIKKWVNEHQTNLTGLYKYYIQQVADLIQKENKKPIVWNDVYDTFGTKLNKDIIVQLWISRHVSNVTNDGYFVIDSSSDVWYLDHLDTPWPTFYTHDPLKGVKNQHLVLGGEVCMWGESMDYSNCLSRIWPRTAAFSERIWNYDIVNEKNSVELADPRLHEFRCHLLSRGISSGLVYSENPHLPSSCFFG